MEQSRGGGDDGGDGGGGNGGQLQIPLLTPPPLNSDSFGEHLFIVLQAD